MKRLLSLILALALLLPACAGKFHMSVGGGSREGSPSVEDR